MSIANLPLTLTKDELLAALEARRKSAEKIDAKNLTAHRKAEVAYLAAFRKGCREALTWDYEKVKENGTWIRIGPSSGRTRAPSCPTSEVSRVDSLVAMVSKQRQPRFTLTHSGKWSDLYRFLTRDVPQIKGLC